MISRIGVIVPATNEQHTVAACLDALLRAEARLEHVVPTATVRIVVVLDRCVDRTAAVLAEYPTVDVLNCSAGSAGAARAAGTDLLLAASDVPPSELWLANTDADSTVPEDWLTRQLDRARAGAHLVLGTVLPAPGLPASSERAWFDKHQLTDDHPHIHGANLGIRADVYESLGGWPELPTGEDVALAESAAAIGHLRIVRTADIPVHTSSRLTGRAPFGFASYLLALSVGETGRAQTTPAEGTLTG